MQTVYTLFSTRISHCDVASFIDLNLFVQNYEFFAIVQAHTYMNILRHCLWSTIFRLVSYTKSQNNARHTKQHRREREKEKETLK